MSARLIGKGVGSARLRRLAGVLPTLLLSAAAAVAAPPDTPRPDGLIGVPLHVRTTPTDSFVELAQRHGVGYVELRAANPDVHPWLPGDGTEVLLPMQHVLPDAPKEGIVINLADLRLYWFPQEGAARSYPIAVGRQGWQTPDGTTRVTRKRRNPNWTPPASIREEKPWLPRVVPAGPDNPLGAHAIDLGWPAYLIHGTNRPAGVGRRVSHGCIRMYPEHVAELFAVVPVGTPVRVVSEPVKFGWMGGNLYMEAHQAGDEIDEVESKGRVAEPGPLDFWPQLQEVAGEALSRVNGPLVLKTLRARRGVPVRITEPAPFAAEAAETETSAVPAAAPASGVRAGPTGALIRP